MAVKRKPLNSDVTFFKELMLNSGAPYKNSYILERLANYVLIDDVIDKYMGKNNVLLTKLQRDRKRRNLPILRWGQFTSLCDKILDGDKILDAIIIVFYRLKKAQQTYARRRWTCKNKPLMKMYVQWLRYSTDDDKLISIIGMLIASSGERSVSNEHHVRELNILKSILDDYGWTRASKHDVSAVDFSIFFRKELNPLHLPGSACSNER